MKAVGALRVILLAALAGYVQSTGAVLTQSLSTFRDLVYAAPFGMGFPTQKFQLIIDDLSSSVRVAEECCVDCCHMKWFNPNKSSSFQAGNDDSWHSCSLGGAGQAGECYGFTETIQIIDGRSHIVLKYDGTSTVQKVDHPTVFTRQPFDGFLGLSPYKDGVISAAVKAELLQSAVYTVNFKRMCAAETGVVDDAGMITYGGLDTTNCDTNVNYKNFDAYGNTWTISEFTLGSTKLASNSDHSWSHVSTSYTEPNIVVPGKYAGTNNINPPPDVMASIVTELQAQKESATGQYTVQCSRVPSFSDLSLVLNGVTYTIEPKDYVYKSGNGKCYIRFRAHEDKEAQTWILGLPLLTRYCQIVDYAKNQIGLAKSLHTALDMCTYSISDAEAQSGTACEAPKDPVTCINYYTMPETTTPKAGARWAPSGAMLLSLVLFMFVRSVQ